MPLIQRRDNGSAVVDFCLVMVVLVPPVLGIMQVALVLYVRNTMTSAASEGARHGATLGGGSDAGAQRTRQLIAASLADDYATQVEAYPSLVEGYPGMVVRARASVPALGLFGPGVAVEVEGHAVQEVTP